MEINIFFYRDGVDNIYFIRDVAHLNKMLNTLGGFMDHKSHVRVY